MKPAQRAKRQPTRASMLKALIVSGRRAKCEIPSCNCMDPTRLEIHHIVPVSFRPIHDTNNLALLCDDHHALIERYYFEKRTSLLPELGQEIQELARKFKTRAIPAEELDAHKQHTHSLWARFNSHASLRNIDWWKATWREAKEWSSRQKILSKVPAKHAIVSEAWYVVA